MFGLKPININFKTCCSLGLKSTLKVYKEASLMQVPSRVISRRIVDAHSFEGLTKNPTGKAPNINCSFIEERTFKNRDIVAHYEIDNNNNPILRRLNVWLKDGRRRNSYTLNYDRQGSIIEMVRYLANGTVQTYKKGADGKYIRPAVMA